MSTFSAAVKLIAVVLLASASLVAVPALAWAQAPVTSFDQVPTRVKVGDTVYVVDDAGQTLKGKLITFSPSSLAILANGQTHDFPAARVHALTVRTHDSLLNGLLIGLGAGVLTGFLLTQGDDYYDFGMSSEAGIYLLFAGIGTGVGLAVDALIPGKKVLVYRPPPSPSVGRISIAPILTPKRQGVAIRVSF